MSSKKENEIVIDIDTKRRDADARESRVERAVRLLQTTAVDPFQLKLREFKAFYPAVVAARHNKMKNKQILKIIADGGLKLYPSLLESLMKAMEQAEGTPACQHCRQTLQIRPAGADAGDPGSTDGARQPSSPLEPA